jgi:hypothetical protein
MSQVAEIAPNTKQGQAVRMSIYSILPDGKLAITATESSSKHDFDFLVGGWKIRNRKLKEPLAGCDEWVEFDATQNLRPIWSAAFSVDEGRTWEWNWYAYFSRP